MALSALAPCAARADRLGCGTVVLPAGVGQDEPSPANSLDPILYSSSLYEQQLADLLYRPLIVTDTKLAIDWPDSLASAIDVSADRTVYTVTLKPWSWSDGTPVTASDVLWEWREIKALGAAYYGYGVGGIPQLIRSVDAPDAQHLRFTTTKPVGPDWFELAGIGQFSAVPAAQWGRLTLQQQQSDQSDLSFYRLSDGPFLLSEFHLGRYAAFVPNPHYGGHKASLRRLVVDFLQGGDPLQALRSGEVDAADLPFEVWDAAQKMTRFQRIEMGPALGFRTLIPNLASPDAPFLADLGVRQAIASAIDQERLIAVAFHGQGIPDRTFVPASAGADVAPDLRGGRGPLAYDPARARALLDAAGWRMGPHGVREKDGRDMRFTVLVSSGIGNAILQLQLVQSDLAAVGIAMEISEVEFNQLLAKMLGPPSGWDSTYMGWTVNSYPDGSQWFGSDSSGNFEHYTNPEMDRLLTAATTEPGTAPLYALENYVALQQPMIDLPTSAITVLARRGINGLNRALQVNGIFSPEYITLSKDLACDDTNAHPPS